VTSIPYAINDGVRVHSRCHIVGKGGVDVLRRLAAKLTSWRWFQKRTFRMGPYTYTGGSGATRGDAVRIVGAKNTWDGLMAEKVFIDTFLSSEGQTWTGWNQELLRRGLRRYDKITVLVDGKVERDFYFDITGFFGKHTFPL
jgi:hypothetical protein